MIDYALGVLSLLVTLLWIRGVWRQTKSDLIASTVIIALVLVIYVFLYRLVVFSGFPWLTAMLCALGSGAVLAVHRKQPAMRKARTFQTIGMVCLSAILFFGEKELNAASNSLLVIAPYRSAGTWVFDDPLAGLKAEPFVSGIPELIDELVLLAALPKADGGFRLIFSSHAFPGHQAVIVWRRQESGGNWYYSEKYDIEGWLCPALFKYFKRAPKEIYVRAESLSFSKKR